ncbi:MAG: serine/threonine protein kinase [Acidobacteria bacterium]|nr:serine/threonine protein kinase [Acidobacteriota bacterium]
MKPLAQNTMIQGRYLIVQLIGKGGMGEVYLAVDQRLGSAVALKRTFYAGDEALGQAFEREARTLARLRHPVLPKVSDHFGEGDQQYLVMEHISGDDLAKRLEVAQKAFPINWVMFWADQLLDALSYLHSHEPPIIHRDIKPQNLKLTDENHIILLDFGLSKSSTGNTLIREDGTGTSSGSSGSVVGYTPHYAPMEQIRGIGTNERSDLYALAATLYQLMTNVVPADALTRADRMLAGIEDPVEPLYMVNTEISKDVSDSIAKAMDLSQDKRYATAREMQKALRKAYAAMQAATSEKTVAFTAEESAKITEQSTAEPQVPATTSFDKTEVMDFSNAAGLAGAGAIAGSIAANEPDPEPVDMDATVAFNSDAGGSEVKQSDLKTEVFIGGAGLGDYGTPAETPPEQLVPEEAAPSDYSTPYDGSSEQPYDATVANFNAGGYGSDSGPSQPDEFYTTPGFTPESESGTDFQNEARSDDEAPFEEPAVAAAAAGSSQPAPAAKKKGSGGKILAIFAGLFAIFILALAGVGGGWYYYTNYYAGGQTDPEPTPLPTFEATPSPEPTLDVTFDSNVNSNSNSNANVNAATPTPTPTPVVETTPGTRGQPTPQRTRTPAGTRTPQRPTPQRPTPTPRRTGPGILQ